jgi:protein AATF/BFR2
VWQRLALQSQRLDAFADDTLDKWHTKTLYSAAGVNVSKLKAINTSFSRQVRQTWDQNRDKLLARSQLRRDAFVPLGKRLATQRAVDALHSPEQHYSFADVDADADADADADLHTAPTSRKSQQQQQQQQQHLLEPDIFDDGDFYQSLLKQLIESGMTETADPVEMSRQWLQVKAATRRRTLHRTDVDRRASKGRKLRYTEHQPLLSFMAPQSSKYALLDSVQATQLALTLFGARPPPHPAQSLYHKFVFTQG